MDFIMSAAWHDAGSYPGQKPTQQRAVVPAKLCEPAKHVICNTTGLYTKRLWQKKAEFNPDPPALHDNRRARWTSSKETSHSRRTTENAVSWPSQRFGWPTATCSMTSCPAGPLEAMGKTLGSVCVYLSRRYCWRKYLHFRHWTFICVNTSLLSAIGVPPNLLNSCVLFIRKQRPPLLLLWSLSGTKTAVDFSWRTKLYTGRLPINQSTPPTGFCRPQLCASIAHIANCLEKEKVQTKEIRLDWGVYYVPSGVLWLRRLGWWLGWIEWCHLFIFDLL